MVMEVKPLQPEKQEAPKLVTEFGMVMEVKPSQNAKQTSPKLVTVSGMVMEVKPLQPEYLEVIDYQLFVVNTIEKWIGCYLWVYGK